ncbi:MULTISPECIES: alanine racemase [Gordonia]|jgi:alanine racemase|uniref:Alanine racemase n=1 Tax=Gordonia alkanivorans CGMCC 6845 TaxID=1423140 RepID=W9DMK6_9ACTN|nr:MULTISPECIES: alanine racemase [Gordonia]ETA08725.1 alanine racemase [Gordonia alkanivorans CGMCC 6845]MDH3005390.1 alanine racemase [Gordonia alkanivorans]MDH3014802.1 alanine racemase [Gordonia alkanivorans]MDH3019107.1 alanine racemase [Gordonia alkanivorans]MDH3023024.1 alanine racemase [Gordonia alkanivorans]
MTSAALTATVDLGAIAHNLDVLRTASNAAVMAVVKADAYGHGAVPVAKAAIAAGAAELGVAHITEARALRAAGIDAPITAWLHTPGADFSGAVTDRIEIALSSAAQLDAVVAAARATGVEASVTAKVDTGLNRSGVAVDEWDDFAEKLAKAHAEGAVTVRAVMCHLARGDEPDHPLNSEQAARLDAAAADLARLGAAPEIMHIANSPAALTRPDLARDLVRPGIALYGRTPVPELGDFGLIPAMTLSARVALVKKVAAGQGVSYSHTWITPHDTVVAIVPAGYADGVPRLLSGRIRVRIADRLFDGIGRICMDQFVVDLGPDGAGVREGDEVELFGTGARGGVTAKDWADAIGTIDYEIVSQVGNRAVRRYLNAGPARGDAVADE